MFDKLNFNNLVISNKKLIQQARAQTIAKLVHKLRKLNNALDKHPDNEKHKQRIRKNAECVAQIKALKCIRIMRSVLLQDGKHNAVLTNGRATPEEIGIAMLGLNKIMQLLVNTFRLKLELGSEADAAWRTEILETSKRRLKVERTEDKRRKRKELKDLKAQERNRVEWLQQNKPEVDQEMGTAVETAAEDCEKEVVETAKEKSINNKLENIESTKELHVDQPRLEVMQPKVIEKPAKRDVKQLKQREKTVKKERLQIDNKKQPKLELKQPRVIEKPAKGVVKQVKEMEKSAKKERLQVDNKKHTQPSVIEKPAKPEHVEPYRSNVKQKKTKVEEKERPTHVVDPFFITESGQPYLSSAVVLSGDSSDESEKEDVYHQEPSRRKHVTRQQDTDKHPSWLAKQQQRPIISSFKGRKIKFGDDGSAVATIAPSAVAPETAAVTADMHPSWIAKQKLKPKIATFMGTKIKFDDD
ncbi:Rlb1 [Drosophila busckii]|uniref:Rlb1 n=1 Tax=Drosophila busckii TaxID=30019 RepID=A0A0M5J564_DROBS|nr:uncharacterized protein LOC108603437 [Drosophila busckii]ALC47086.1 Rlb1 [Drosophila busckii]